MQRIIFGISAFVVFAVTAMSSSAGMAQEKPAEAVVVTAGRIEQQLDEAIPHTSVITQKEIRESQATDLIQLLKREAGLEFVQNGGIGTTGSVFMRGGGSTSSLILIDGIRVGSATSGAAQLGQIMLGQIERVEIARGNVSALYGANAVGGVIQIFTKRGLGDPRGEMQATVGEHGTRGVSGGYGGKIGDTRFSLNVAQFATNGFSAQDPKTAPTRINPDADGYTNLSFSGQVSHMIGQAHEFGLRAYQSKGRAGFDNAFSPDTPQTVHFTDSEVGQYSAFSNNRINDVWTSKLNLSQANDNASSRTGGGTPTRFDTLSTQAQWQNDLTVAKGHVVSVTLDDQRQRVASTTAYTYTGRTVGGAGLGYLGKIGDHQVQLASREDRYSDFGKANTWLGGYGYNLDSDWKLTAMRSTAFRAPSFNDMFFPGSVSLDVKPETTQSNELGVQYAAGGHLLRMVRFSTQYLNLIEFPAPAFIARNVGKASVEGTEVSYTGQYASWDLRTSLTLQTPVNALTGVQLIRRSTQFGNIVANTMLGGWKVGGEYAFSAKRLDTDLDGARVELDAYQTVKLTARHDFGKQWYVAAKLENLFDERYQGAYGFNQPSRGLFMTVGWKQ